MPAIILSPKAAIRPVVTPALVGFLADTNEQYLIFDNQTPLFCSWEFRMPSDFGSSPSVIIELQTENAAGTQTMDVAIKSVADNAVVSAVPYGAAANSAFVTGGANQKVTNSIVPTGLVASQYTSLRLSRQASGVAALTWVFSVTLEYVSA